MCIRDSHELETQMRPLIHTFAPLFFVMVGVSLNLNTVDWSSGFVWQLGGLLLLVGFVGKLAAGFFIKEPRTTQIAIGLAMIPREMCIRDRFNIGIFRSNVCANGQNCYWQPRRQKQISFLLNKASIGDKQQNYL